MTSSDRYLGPSLMIRGEVGARPLALPVLWQRPRGNTVFFDMGDTQGVQLRLVALDSDGSEIAVQDVSVVWSGP